MCANIVDLLAKVVHNVVFDVVKSLVDLSNAVVQLFVVVFNLLHGFGHKDALVRVLYSL